MTDASVEVATTGLRLQRHLTALYAGKKLYVPETNQKAAIKTGITVEYSIHTKDVPGATEDDHVVLIMGFRQTKEAWAATVDQLTEQWSSSSKNLKIASFDNRGIGGTDAHFGRYTTTQMAEDTLALMDHLDWNAAHIVGVSMGGMISLELAATAPKRVKSLSLIVTTRGKYVNEHGNDAMRRSILSSEPKVIVNSVLEMLYPESFLSKKMEDKDETIRDALYQFHDYRRETSEAPRLRGIIGQVLAIRTHFVSDERLAAIGKAGFPVLIMGGKQDRLIPGSESQLIADLMKSDKIKLLLYEDGGHGLFVQYLDEFIQELLGNFTRSSL